MFKFLNIPTDYKLLKTIYQDYHQNYVAYTEDESIRKTKIYVPIDCNKIATKLKVDVDLVFGRLYYNLEEKYGFKKEDNSSVHFFSLEVGNDKHCINFPLMSSVLAGLKREKNKFNWTEPPRVSRRRF